MKRLFLLGAAIAIPMLAYSAPTATAVPHIWPGFSCGSGYYSSGGACVPNSSSTKYGIAKTKKSFSCGSGYYSSGDMCVANSSSTKHGFARSGSCPSGYYASSDMCIKN